MAVRNQALGLSYQTMNEDDLVRHAQQGHRDAFRVIMERCNQRLFRVARGVVRDDGEAEDVVQEAYARAFEKIDTFRGEAGILTWLTRITLNEANGRLRRRRPTASLEQAENAQREGAHVILFPPVFGSENPEAAVARKEIRQLLEGAIDELPEPFRLVFIMRDIEECSIQETADNLDLRAETVKTRLHRARRLLRRALDQKLASIATEAFPFLGARCQRITDAVLARLDLDREVTGAA